MNKNWIGLVVDYDATEMRVMEQKVHDPDRCSGEACPIHNPSVHPLTDAPLVLRLDLGATMSRVCEHQVLHPDPDSMHTTRERSPEWCDFFEPELHDCDGCCK